MEDRTQGKSTAGYYGPPNGLCVTFRWHWVGGSESQALKGAIATKGIAARRPTASAEQRCPALSPRRFRRFGLAFEFEAALKAIQN